MPLFRVQGVDELKMEAGQSAPLDVEVNVGRHGDWGKAGMVTKTIFFCVSFYTTKSVMRPNKDTLF